MDIESRLQKIKAQVHEIRILVWVVLALVVAQGLGVLQVDLIIGLGVIYLLASAISGLWQFWACRRADAQLPDKILQEFIAERAKTRGQDSNP